MSKEKENLETLFLEFRIWNRNWNAWNADKTKPPPLLLDDFIEELNKKYKVKIK